MSTKNKATIISLQKLLDDTPENILFLDALLGKSAEISKTSSFTKIVTSESILYAQGANMILRRDKNPEELFGLVVEVPEFVNLLLTLSDWTCCSVSNKQSKAVGAELSKRLGRSVKYFPCSLYACDQVHKYELVNPETVRLATEKNLADIRNSVQNDASLQDFIPKRLEDFIGQKLVAISTESGMITSIVTAEAITPSHVMFMYYTNENYRGRRLASDGHYLVLKQALQKGLTPVTSIASDNNTSRRVSERFGYRIIAGEEYVIV